MYQLDVDFLKMKNGELPTIRELLNKNSTWPCNCGTLDNSVGKIICKNCSKYRPLETYTNLVFNPLLSEKSEIKEFNMRRKHEEKVYQSLSARKMDNLKHAYFFAIDISWFNKWRSFIYNDDKSSKFLENCKKYISDNKKIGILPPGIIDNSGICVPNKEKEKGASYYVLKPGLKIDKDFCVVNQYLWEWYLLNYGGGPEIQLDENFCKNMSLSNGSILNEDDCNNKKLIDNMNVNSYLNNKKFEEKKEQDANETSPINELDRKSKYKISLENIEEIKIYSKNFNSKFTDIKPPKKQINEDKIFIPEVKQRLIKSLISDINI